MKNWYKRSQNQTAQDLNFGLGEFGGGIGQGMQDKNREYAQSVVSLIQGGQNPQAAFDQVMTEHGIGVDQRTGQKTGSMMAMRQAVINEVKKMMQPVQGKQAQTNQFGMEEPARANDVNVENQGLNEFKSMPQGRNTLPANIKKKLNNSIYNVTNDYYDQIPINEIFNILKSQNVVPLQEDGTEWSGMLIGGAECGSDEARSQVANFPLAQRVGEELVPFSNAELMLMWCKMSSGRYEIISYVS
jgi:hypothetical protein